MVATWKPAPRVFVVSFNMCMPGPNSSTYCPCSSVKVCPVGLSDPMPQFARTSTPAMGRPTLSVTLPFRENNFSPDRGLALGETVKGSA